MNMLEFMQRMSRLKGIKTKEDFGRAMHGDEFSEDEKEEILKAVEEAGGYDNLED